MERNIPIILGGLAALVGIVYIVYKSTGEVPTGADATGQTTNLNEVNADADPQGISGSQPANNQGITGTTVPTDK
jgi:hypothetical protein